MTKISFVGEYTKYGGKYYSEKSDTKLIVGHRKNPTNKTRDFILFVGRTHSRPQFFSSLFPTKTQNLFYADHQGVDYSITLSEGNLQIKERTDGKG